MSADEPYVPTEVDISTTGSLCMFFAGNAAAKWQSIPSSGILEWLSKYYLTTDTPSPADILAETGWSEDFYMTFEAMMGNISDIAPVYADILTLVPHPRIRTFIIPVFAAFTAISTIVLALRIWSRISIAGKLQAFDWATLFAYMLIVAWGGLAVHESTAVGGWGFYCDQTFEQARAYERAWGILTFTYPIAVLAIKVSLLLFYHQLSAWRPLRISVYVTGFICFANAMCGVFLWVYQCTTPNLWDHMVDLSNNMSCPLDQMTVLMAVGGVGIFTDVVIWLIPIPMVWQLQLNTRERVLAVCTFGVGLVACVGSVMRLVAIRRFLYYGNEDGNDSRDPINAWAVVEMNLALICACVPALRALVVKHVPRIISRTSDGTDVSKGSKGSSSYKGHGKPSIVSEEEGNTNASELGDYPRNSNTEKPEPNVKVWSPITNYKGEEYSRMQD
ncbi:hypothetical protein TWF225_007298 [Orbilia oligospora]|uniref:Rhodopsin domain-containing protein n=1 Tax=Orbilia oligospora TaxID=2813651 RepID=A0A7C8PDZ8_ORBOL|nr:hypothetical protein TWF751_003592 [Orbilia oligospora]KAF3180439.1 hypothetical protein TWF225_007298 [Orbilia oligospora]KAF3238166.1 hypothetical protein TWF128_000675 [Orbilia oligospora]KAF3241775.1 hypothetical protein TWF217_011946 [Orbilia oligospora]KAF3295667.1 hypothetical protein TWF132_000996 [Orbilia oligospora]